MCENAKRLVITVLDGGDMNAAEELSERIGAPITSEPGDGLSLVFDDIGVMLAGCGLSLRGDFEGMLRRVTGGRLNHEMLVKLSKTKEQNPTAIDAAAGMGEDAFILAAAGYDVTLFEHDPVIAALLKDALKRALNNPELKKIVGRMKLIEGDGAFGMASLKSPPDLIYLDPMFPERTKSGLVGKKLQLLQKLEKPCSSESELLKAALSAKPKKIIIKRPLNGPYLAGRKPGYSVKGKAIRYDCIVPFERQ